MESRTLSLLEFPKVLERLATLAVSEPAATACRAIVPLGDPRRLAEEQRKAEEEARRAADKEHRRTVNRRVYADLIAQGIPEEFAQKAVLAIAGGKVQDAHIKY